MESATPRLTLWEEGTPAAVTNLPALPETNPYTMFCAGMTWMVDGTLLVAGGTNYAEGCPNNTPNYGHNRGFVFDPFASPSPAWATVLSLPGGTLMGDRRWYPTVSPLTNGDALILGHTAEPSGNQEDNFEFYSLANHFEGSVINRSFDTPSQPGACDDTTVITVQDYPRGHQILNGSFFWSSAAVPNLNPLCSVGGTPCPVAAFFDYTSNFQCSVAPTIERWRVYGGVGGGFEYRDQPNSVQLLFPKQVGTEYDEVIYLIGGLPRSSTISSSNVDRIVNPDIAATVWDTSAPDLNRGRTEANTVIALDGSLIAIGGRGNAAGGALEPVLEVERLATPEIFGGSQVWQTLASHQTTREYHAVAGLLPNGKIFSAGGEDAYSQAFGEPEHTVEVFSPPYLFRGPRPRITQINPTPPLDWDYNQIATVNYTVSQGRSIERVALIRNAAVTHAFDSSQRYVQLHITANTGTLVNVSTPPSGNVAPPGYYMLTLIDSCGVPSPAKFILLD